MQAVLISIRPKWCEKIANGWKTIEVRKTKPKLEPPFKCYIYCTNQKPFLVWGDVFRGNWETEFTHLYGYNRKDAEKIWDIFNGNVMGEFVCDKILDIFVSCSDSNMKGYPFPGTGLTDREIMDYLGNGKTGYGWHISNLEVYDTPKALSEFKPWSRECKFEHLGLAIPKCQNCHACKVERAPQSWCYVEQESG